MNDSKQLRIFCCYLVLGRERFGAWGYLRFLHNREARSYPLGFDQHILVGLFRGVIAKIVELVDEDRRTLIHRKRHRYKRHHEKTWVFVAETLYLWANGL